MGVGTTSVFIHRRRPEDLIVPLGILGSITQAAAAQPMRVGQGNLTAYRPMQGPNSYGVFGATAVQEVHEADDALGPGIRLNTDFDNGGATQDRLLGGSTIGNENDLIQIVIEPVANGHDWVLVVGDDLAVFPAYSMGTQIFVDGTTHRTDPLAFPDGHLTLFVEWATPGHGGATIDLLDATTNTVHDTLVFHTFQGIVIGLSGQDFWGMVDSFENGVLDIARGLYERGYDARYHNHNDVNAVWSAGSGPVYDEIVRSIQQQGVTHVGLFGHSHGGGGVFNLAYQLNVNRASIGTFTLDATGYIDAIEQFRRFPEKRYPVGSVSHINYFQRRLWPPARGYYTWLDANNVPLANPIGENVYDLGWRDEFGDPLNHNTIDNSIDVQIAVRNFFLAHMTR